MKRIGVDIGGTFTDLVAYDESSGQLSRWKVLTDTEHPDRSFLTALREASVKLSDVNLLLHATTIVTNLLIERKGATVGLLATTGFRDLLDMQLAWRPQPFNYVQWTKVKPLVPREYRLEIDERLSHTGEVVKPLADSQVRAAARRLAGMGVESIAICFLHSFSNPAHELRAAEIVHQELPDVPISLSHQVDPTIREYERTSTTVINAYAQPAVQDYIDGLQRTLPLDIRYMHSGGGLIPAATAKLFPIVLAESGPAAGVLACVHLASLGAGADLITFDMGGSSCDVALIRSGEPTMRDSIEIDWNTPARTLSIDVSSVGAGGGSIAWVDPGGALMVGPESSGSNPGPACYGFGGKQPTVTDANLCLGLISEELLGGRLQLSRAAATNVLSALGDRLHLDATATATAIHRIVGANMAIAIRHLTIEKGIDPRDFRLVSFGGAGGQHAASVARELGIRTVLFPPNASTFSAMGLLTSDLSMSQARTMWHPFKSVDLREVAGLVDSLRDECTRLLASNVQGASDPSRTALLDLRYVGQTHYVSVPFEPELDDHPAIYRRFEAAHESLFGTRLGDPIELVNVRVVVRRELPALQLKRRESNSDPPREQRRESQWVELEGRVVEIIDRESIAEGKGIDGPLLVSEVDSMYYVPSGWRVDRGILGSLVMESQLG